MNGRNTDLVEFIADDQGILLGLSPSWQVVTGFTTQGVLGTPLAERIWPDDRGAFREELESLLRRDPNHVCRPLRLITSSGSPRRVELCVVARIEAAAQRGDIFGAFVDMDIRTSSEGAARE